MDDADRSQMAIDAANDSGIAAVLCLVRGAAQGSGICIDCGEPIAPGRRSAYPAARRCLDCQVIEETHERRRATA